MSVNDTKHILTIETSCDETGISLLSCSSGYPDQQIKILADELASQVDDHQEYGGVFPSLAKRLHGENLPVLLQKILEDVETRPVSEIPVDKKQKITDWLSRHDILAKKLFDLVQTHGLPKLDAVAVTVGPGLEPALWVGINTARSIALILDVDIIPVNHMEGHLVSALAPDTITNGEPHALQPIQFPAVSLLVSGGHTELIHIPDWQSYKKIGQTRDDAAGEAFDKVGRLLELPYPAGPHVSDLAAKAPKDAESEVSLPRPMMQYNTLDFSFSGLKTAAARYIEKNGPFSDAERAIFARELEEAIVDVLVFKTTAAIEKTGAKTLLVGGGVSANQNLRSRLQDIKKTTVYISPVSLSGDNAVMIGLAAAGRYNDGIDPESEISADSRLSL
jgi:N6-L-threonylcarbamoyladenine synthase